MSIEKAILFLVLVMGGGLLSLLIRKNNIKFLKLLLAFTGAYIMGIIFLHLAPEVYAGGNGNAGYFVLIGFFLQLLLEHLSKGVEHGHIHLHEGQKKNTYAMQVLIGLCLHSFLEGMPLSAGFEEMGHNHHHGDEGHAHDHGEGLLGSAHLFWGIVAHHVPAAFALGALFLAAGYSQRFIFLGIFTFAAMTPAGAWSAGLFTWTEAGFTALIAIVLGAFLHIATTILFEADDATHHRISFKKLIAVILGIGIALLSTLL
jgi:zinc transporter ZupT